MEILTRLNNWINMFINEAISHVITKFNPTKQLVCGYFIEAKIITYEVIVACEYNFRNIKLNPVIRIQYNITLKHSNMAVSFFNSKI